MPPSEEAKKEKEQLFGSYSGTLKEKPDRRRSIIIMICATVCVALGVVGAAFWPKAAPYDDLVSRLHPRMAKWEVDQELGKPSKSGFSSGDPHFSGVYGVPGTDLKLIIQFDNRADTISDLFIAENWCVVASDQKRQSGDPVRYEYRDGQIKEAPPGEFIKYECRKIK